MSVTYSWSARSGSRSLNVTGCCEEHHVCQALVLAEPSLSSCVSSVCGIPTWRCFAVSVSARCRMYWWNIWFSSLLYNMCMHTHIYIYSCIHTCINIIIPAYIYLYIYICKHMYACTFVCIFIQVHYRHIYIDTYLKALEVNIFFVCFLFYCRDLDCFGRFFCNIAFLQK